MTTEETAERSSEGNGLPNGFPFWARAVMIVAVMAAGLPISDYLAPTFGPEGAVLIGVFAALVVVIVVANLTLLAWAKISPRYDA